jgi:syntaxin 16
MDSEADRSFSQSAILHSREQQQSQKRRPNANEAVIAHREREIEAIAQGVIELASIFQDLNSMVIDQGSLLDRIDYNVENTLTQVKEADKELKVAGNYQRRSVKRKIILLLILIVAGMFILLGLKLGKRNSDGGSSGGGRMAGGAGDNVGFIGTDGAPFRALDETYLLDERHLPDERWTRRRRRGWVEVRQIGSV